MRGLSNPFMNDLKSGILLPFLELVREDESLSLEIREESVNIYFCGGSLIRIDRKPSGYEAFFDPKYLDPAKTRVPNLPTRLTGVVDVGVWMNAVPHLKHEMGLWISRRHKYEREAQQLLVRENNSVLCLVKRITTFATLSTPLQMGGLISSQFTGHPPVKTGRARMNAAWLSSR